MYPLQLPPIQDQINDLRIRKVVARTGITAPYRELLRAYDCFCGQFSYRVKTIAVSGTLGDSPGAGALLFGKVGSSRLSIVGL